MIEQGQNLPDGLLSHLTKDGMNEHQTSELFKDKKVVLFAVPGAFTPTCSAAHLPGYITLADEFQAKGVDVIACVSVNDAFVMKAWGDSQNAEHIMMLADGDGSFTKAIGLEMETGSFGGLRSKRYAMIIENGVVTKLNVEAPKEFEVSKAEVMLKAL
ncbi:peroxiredoxin [Shewanella sp. 202IG2-18]|uniref:peroxiredoxin n=1 Tax=Parashewanella hymeniacidonis TaxID=2807618 RepID=UPI0019609F6E|nr:peroxiredoxin [Parashewanella hymeniacidonis]MBM7072777.1 peroxiredoxin [Parashewanella hymeniacidonis]